VKAAAVIFDFDGLLMDTESVMLAAWQHEWRQHGLELDVSTFWVNHGGDVTEDRYLRLAAAVGPSYDRAASHARRAAYRDELNRQLGLRPGLDAWLRDAHAAGLRLAVASSSPRQWVHRLLAGIGREADFEVFACGDEVARPKPSPEVYLLALNRLGIAAGQAVAVEDSPHGAAAGRPAVHRDPQPARRPGGVRVAGADPGQCGRPEPGQRAGETARLSERGAAEVIPVLGW
jgi:HAD superfamily hydrolase (TIGR01509 family)